MSQTTQKNLRVLAVLGAYGRMGQAVIRLAGTRGWQTIPVGREGLETLKEKVDVVVDFSMPDGLMSALTWCVAEKVPLVSGTTALNSGQKAKLEAAANQIPILWTANMSLGVHVLAQTLEKLAAIKDWDFHIEETHHQNKKDKPSGTALFLQTQLEAAIGKRIPGPESRREGDVVGIHRVVAMSSLETLSFQHEAGSRDVFAQGALTAAAWLMKRKERPRLYQMSDVLQDP